MVIQTSKCDFLIEECGRKDGCVFVYSDSLDEIQRFFGSLETEYSTKMDWKYRVTTCKQDLTNSLILMVKEVNYLNFFEKNYQKV